MPLQRSGRRSNRSRQRGRPALRLLAGGADQDNAELVAAETADQIAGAGILKQDGSNTAQHRVARGMTVPVIDLLQVVDVKIEDARWETIAFRKGDRAAQLANESPAIGHRYQRVLVHKAFELRDSGARLCQFAAQPRDLGRCSVGQIRQCGGFRGIRLPCRRAGRLWTTRCHR